MGRENLKNLKIVIVVIAIVAIVAIVAGLIFYFVVTPYVFSSGDILGTRSGLPPFPASPDPSQAPLLPK